MIAATSGQIHTSESANHSASCSTAYASVCPANWLEHIRESLKTLSLCCNTQAKNHVRTIPVPPRLGGADAFGAPMVRAVRADDQGHDRGLKQPPHDTALIIIADSEFHVIEGI